MASTGFSKAPSAETGQLPGKAPQAYVPPPPGLGSVVAQARDRDVPHPTGRGPCSCSPLCSCGWGGRGVERPVSGSRRTGSRCSPARPGASRNAGRPGAGRAPRCRTCAFPFASWSGAPRLGAGKSLAPRGRWDVHPEDAALHWLFFCLSAPHGSSLWPVPVAFSSHTRAAAPKCARGTCVPQKQGSG